MNRDALFIRVLYVLIAFFALYIIAGMLVLVIAQPGATAASRFFSSLGTMFVGLLGLVSGYLLKSNGK